MLPFVFLVLLLGLSPVGTLALSICSGMTTARQRPVPRAAASPADVIGSCKGIIPGASGAQPLGAVKTDAVSDAVKPMPVASGSPVPEPIVLKSLQNAIDALPGPILTDPQPGTLPFGQVRRQARMPANAFGYFCTFADAPLDRLDVVPLAVRADA
ncbi:MAG: hypothetical protein M1832_000312 [Thelocarpon impressellum]|nr:MAG: hypothetical protein M1832_000312 [Thelocarpon impressellum]